MSSFDQLEVPALGLSFILSHVLPFDSGMEQQVAQLLSTLFLQERIATPNYHSIYCFDGSYGSK
jgi:hypothetical protein